MEIGSITNKNNRTSVCEYYLHKDLNMDKTKIIVGENLRIVYLTGAYFVHEKVIKVERFENGSIIVETDKKIWMIHE